MLYKKAAGQEADNGAIEEGTQSRLRALEADLDGMVHYMTCLLFKICVSCT